MRHLVLEERDGSADGYRLVLAVSGFAALDLLADEDGYHVLETPKGEGGDRGGFERLQVRVRVAPQPAAAAASPEALLAEARGAFAGAGAAVPRVVRRYRREPSPLVRDGVRGWRTGRLDLFLAGDFDLMD
jgi:ATP-dependent Clp protease ATP-binding subunit ClpC